MRNLRLRIQGVERAPGRVIKLQNGNWFGLCYMCGAHHHSLTWKTAFFRMENHIVGAHTYTLET